jgi:hypothetical protein
MIGEGLHISVEGLLAEWKNGRILRNKTQQTVCHAVFKRILVWASIQ